MGLDTPNLTTLFSLLTDPGSFWPIRQKLDYSAFLVYFSFHGLHNGLLSCMEIGVAWAGQDQQVFTVVALLRYPVRQYLLACLHCIALPLGILRRLDDRHLTRRPNRHL